MQTRFVIGVDLGTTNTALAFVDTGAGGALQCQTFAIPQVVNPGDVAGALSISYSSFGGGAVVNENPSAFTITQKNDTP